jgi:hypothetical protein
MGRETGSLQLLAPLLLTGENGADLVIRGNVVLNTVKGWSAAPAVRIAESTENVESHWPSPTPRGRELMAMGRAVLWVERREQMVSSRLRLYFLLHGP